MLDEGRCGSLEARREQLPRQEPSEHQDYVRESLTRDVDGGPEDEREDRGCCQGLQDCPGDAKEGLAVAQLYVAQHEEQEQLAIATQLAHCRQAKAPTI